MLNTTNEAVRSILKADPTITTAERTRILGSIRSHGRDPEPEKAQPVNNRIVRRAEVAERLGRSLRMVDILASQGVIRKVTLPGRTRAVGFRSEDVELLLTGADA